MYERTCPQRLDEPLVVWLGLEFGEIVTSLAVGMLTASVGSLALGLGAVGLILGVGAGAGTASLLRARRSGGPGAVFGRLYRWGVVDLLPAGVRPRYLLPVRWAERPGRLRLSPVKGERNGRRREGGRLARIYFGR